MHETLAGLVPWITAHGYFIFFIVAVLKGSLVSTAAGVVAGLGVFNIFIVLGISIMGDLVGDVGYYALGHYGRNLMQTRFARHLGFKGERMEKAKKILHNHTRKALWVIKLSPLLGPPGLVTIGVSGVPFKRFFKITFFISVLKSIFFTFLGYFSARTYVQLSKFISHNQYLILGLGVVVVLIYILYQKVTARLSNRLEG